MGFIVVHCGSVVESFMVLGVHGRFFYGVGWWICLELYLLVNFGFIGPVHQVVYWGLFGVIWVQLLSEYNINNNNSLKINLALFGTNWIFWSRRGTLLTSSEPKKRPKRIGIFTRYVIGSYNEDCQTSKKGQICQSLSRENTIVGITNFRHKLFGTFAF